MILTNQKDECLKQHLKKINYLYLAFLLFNIEKDKNGCNL